MEEKSDERKAAARQALYHLLMCDEDERENAEAMRDDDGVPLGTRDSAFVVVACIFGAAILAGLVLLCWPGK